MRWNVRITFSFVGTRINLYYLQSVVHRKHFFLLLETNRQIFVTETMVFSVRVTRNTQMCCVNEMLSS